MTETIDDSYLPEAPPERKPNSYELISSPDAYFAYLRGGIRGASSRVDLKFFSCQNDRVGRPIVANLVGRSDQIESRLCVDDYMNISHQDRYLWLPRTRSSLRREIHDAWRDTRRLLAEVQNEGVDIEWTRGNHVKLAIIDGDVPGGGEATVGGIEPTEHNAGWRDFMVRMTGEVVGVLQEHYDRTWAGAQDAGFVEYDDGMIVTDGRGYSNILPTVVRLIEQAKERVILESPYLFGRDVWQALQAKAPTAEVSVMVPSHNHKKVFTPSERRLTRAAESGVRVNRFPGMTHARYAIIDDIVVFGSHPFNSILAGRTSELAIFSHEKSLVAQLEAFWKSGIEQSQSH